MIKVFLAILSAIITWFIIDQMNAVWVKIIEELSTKSMLYAMNGNRSLFFFSQTLPDFLLYTASGYFFYKWMQNIQVVLIGIYLVIIIGLFQTLYITQFTTTITFNDIFFFALEDIIPPLFFIIGYQFHNKKNPLPTLHNMEVYQAHSLLNLILLYLGGGLFYLDGTIASSHIVFGFLAWQAVTMHLWRKKVLSLFKENDSTKLSEFPLWMAITLQVLFYDLFIFFLLGGILSLLFILLLSSYVTYYMINTLRNNECNAAPETKKTKQTKKTQKARKSKSYQHI